MRRKFMFWFFGAILFIALVNIVVILSLVRIENISVEPRRDIYNKGILFRVGPVVFVFGHGTWNTNDEYVVRHITTVSGENFPTDSLIYNLRRQGAKYIWMSACHAGDYDFMVLDRISGKRTAWPENISRGGPGNVVPVWLGLWIGYLQYGSPEKVDTSRIVFKNVSVAISPNTTKHIGDSIDTGEYVSAVVKAIQSKTEKYQWPEYVVFNKRRCRIEGIKVKKQMTWDEMGSEFTNHSTELSARAYKKGKSYKVTVYVYPIIEP